MPHSRLTIKATAAARDASRVYEDATQEGSKSWLAAWFAIQSTGSGGIKPKLAWTYPRPRQSSTSSSPVDTPLCYVDVTYSDSTEYNRWLSKIKKADLSSYSTYIPAGQKFGVEESSCSDTDEPSDLVVQYFKQFGTQMLGSPEKSAALLNYFANPANLSTSNAQSGANVNNPSFVQHIWDNAKPVVDCVVDACTADTQHTSSEDLLARIDSTAGMIDGLSKFQALNATMRLHAQGTNNMGFAMDTDQDRLSHCFMINHAVNVTANHCLQYAKDYITQKGAFTPPVAANGNGSDTPHALGSFWSDVWDGAKSAAQFIAPYAGEIAATAAKAYLDGRTPQSAVKLSAAKNQPLNQTNILHQVDRLTSVAPQTLIDNHTWVAQRAAQSASDKLAGTLKQFLTTVDQQKQLPFLNLLEDQMPFFSTVLGSLQEECRDKDDKHTDDTLKNVQLNRFETLKMALPLTVHQFKDQVERHAAAQVENGQLGFSFGDIFNTITGVAGVVAKVVPLFI